MDKRDFMDNRTEEEKHWGNINLRRQCALGTYKIILVSFGSGQKSGDG